MAWKSRPRHSRCAEGPTEIGRGTSRAAGAGVGRRRDPARAARRGWQRCEGRKTFGNPLGALFSRGRRGTSLFGSGAKFGSSSMALQSYWSNTSDSCPGLSRARLRMQQVMPHRMLHRQCESCSCGGQRRLLLLPSVVLARSKVLEIVLKSLAKHFEALQRESGSIRERHSPYSHVGRPKLQDAQRDATVRSSPDIVLHHAEQGLQVGGRQDHAALQKVHSPAVVAAHQLLFQI